MHSNSGRSNGKYQAFPRGKVSKEFIVLLLVMVVALVLLGAGSAVGMGESRSLVRATLPDGVPQSALRLPNTQIHGGMAEIIVEMKDRSLAEEQAFRRNSGLPELDNDGQKNHVHGLKGSQEALKERLEGLGAHVTQQYAVTFSGLAARVEADKLQAIAALPEVKAVHRARIAFPALDKSVPFIFGGKTNAQIGADGTGVTIAIIDTGIDYTHAALGGSGDPADYAGNDPTVIEPGTFPTAKVIGGTDLVGEFYDPSCPAPGPPPSCTDVPVPDPDPLDLEGHGTHVSGIAAGMGGGSVPQGVAPGAKLMAIKVFGVGGTSEANIVAAIDLATDPNQDGDTSDHVDVINMSLGSPLGSDFEPDAAAANAAAALGVVVVASAGNSGDILYITGSPASASGAISVAAGNDPGVAIQFMDVLGSAGADGGYESVEAAFTPSLASTGTVSGLTQFVGLACDVGGPGGPNPFAPGSLAGKVPLIQRGACRFDEKVVNAQEAGAIGAVVFNNVSGGGPFSMGGDPIAGIPAVMIGNQDGLSLVSALIATTTFTLDPANVTPVPDRLQDFTSSGPRFMDSALKPDISAPGGGILSAAAGTGTEAIALSGTSMSSPHIAGVAALLRQLHPTWSPSEIKSLLMNTATDNVQPNGQPYPLTRMGAGRVRVDVAADTESLLMPGSVTFGRPEQSQPGVMVFRSSLTVANKSDARKTFDLSASLLFPPTDGSQISFDLPRTIAVNGNTAQPFDLRVQVAFTGEPPDSVFQDHEGFLVLTETTGGQDVLRVPFRLSPGAARAAGEAIARRDEVELRNRGARATQVDFYQLGVLDPNEDLITEPAGAPQRPDDWFDIRHTGAHAFDSEFGRVVEFGVSVYGTRSIANPLVTEVLIDVDKDGLPDYDVVAADLGVLLGGDFNGTMVTAIFELTSGAGILEFPIANDPNVSWQTLPFVLDDLNALGAAFGAPTIDEANPDFDYFVVSSDDFTLSFDITDTARFNVLAQELGTNPQIVTLLPRERMTVTVVREGEANSLLALFYNNVSGLLQSDVVQVRPR